VRVPVNLGWSCASHVLGVAYGPSEAWEKGMGCGTWAAERNNPLRLFGWKAAG